MLRAWQMVVAFTVAALATPAGPPVPTVLKAVPAPEWDALFARKEGWIGGDGVASALLGDRVFWLFGDTLLGTVKDGARPGAAMVNNTVGVQARPEAEAPIRFTAGRTRDGKPAAVFTPADARGWFWPQAAVCLEDRLFVFLAQIDRTAEPGVFGFKQIGEWLAVVPNPRDFPTAWRVMQHKLPFAAFGPGPERSWGSAVLADGAHVYIYGYQEKGKGLDKRRLAVARAPAGTLDDFTTWRFRAAAGWSEQPADAAMLAEGLATEFSVSRFPGSRRYAAVYTESGLGARVVGRFADAPDGPWSPPVLLYTCPEMGADRGVFSYAAKAHGWAAGRNELLVSYCVNTWDFGRLFRDAEVYRPKFVRLTLRAPD